MYASPCSPRKPLSPTVLSTGVPGMTVTFLGGVGSGSGSGSSTGHSSTVNVSSSVSVELPVPIGYASICR